MKIFIYKDGSNFYRWRLVASNGRNLANGGEGFTRKLGVKRSLRAVKKAFGSAKIIDTTKV